MPNLKNDTLLEKDESQYLLVDGTRTATSLVVTGSSASDLLRITQTGTGNALVVEDSANPDSTPFIVRSDGKLIHGHTGVEGEWYTSSGTAHKFYIVDNSSVNNNGGNLWISRYNGNAGLTIARSNGTNIGDRGTIVSGDAIGEILWAADDGISGGQVRSARIIVTAEGTIGTGIVPSRMTFHTGNTTGNDTERMRINSAGEVGIGVTATTSIGLRLGKQITGAINAYGMTNQGVVQSDVTSSGYAYYSGIGTQAAAFTLSDMIHYAAVQGTIGAGSTVAEQVGFLVSPAMIGGTVNVGFKGSLALGTNRYNLYMAGTAANYMAGRLGVGAILTSGAMAQITNTTAADKAFVVKGAASQSGSLFETQNSAGTALVVVNSSGQTIIGSATAVDINGTPQFSVLQTVPSIAVGRFSNDTGYPRLKLSKSRSGTIGTNTTVQNGDGVGTIEFLGADGTSYVRASEITSVVDGTPGTNDMPGRLVFSTTADGSASPMERMRINSAGRVGIGFVNPSYQLHVYGGSASVEDFAMAVDVAGGNAGDSAGYVMRAADTNELGAIRSYVESSYLSNMRFYTAGATNVLTERMRINSAGEVGIGAASSTGVTLFVAKNITGATTAFGIAHNGTVQSGVTSTAYGFSSRLNTAATAFTLSNLIAFQATAGTTGATSTITNAYGFNVPSTFTQGSTTNIGFQSALAAGTGRWNLYMAGTAANYLAGRLGVGEVNTSGAMAQIVNTTAADIGLIVRGAAGQSGNLQEWRNSAGSVVSYVASDGSSSFGNPADGDQSILANSVFG